MKKWIIFALTIISIILIVRVGYYYVFVYPFTRTWTVDPIQAQAFFDRKIEFELDKQVDENTYLAIEPKPKFFSSAFSVVISFVNKGGTVKNDDIIKVAELQFSLSNYVILVNLEAFSDCGFADLLKDDDVSASLRGLPDKCYKFRNILLFESMYADRVIIPPEWIPFAHYDYQELRWVLESER